MHICEEETCLYGVGALVKHMEADLVDVGAYVMKRGHRKVSWASNHHTL